MITQILTHEFDNNFSYFVGNKHVAIVDPSEVSLLEKEIMQDGLIPEAVFVTHTHSDHVSGVAGIVEKYAVPVYVHENGKGKLDVDGELIVYVEDGEVIKLRDVDVKVMHTPGHIEDAICFYITAEQSGGAPVLLTGDTIFVEGCGRADLETSDVEALYKSIQRIKKLPDETVIYPGHHYGSEKTSTVGKEKKRNKYFKCGDLEEFISLRIG